MLAGLHAQLRIIAENVTMDTAGTAQPDGTTDWDFSAALARRPHRHHHDGRPAGQWFASQFPTATYTSKLRDTQTLLGVYQATAAALLLQGVVTPTRRPGQTEVSATRRRPRSSPSRCRWARRGRARRPSRGTADGIPDRRTPRSTTPSSTRTGT